MDTHSQVGAMLSCWETRLSTCALGNENPAARACTPSDGKRLAGICALGKKTAVDKSAFYSDPTLIYPSSISLASNCLSNALSVIELFRHISEHLPTLKAALRALCFTLTLKVPIETF